MNNSTDIARPNFQRDRTTALEEPLQFISTSATDRQSVEFMNKVFSDAIDKAVSDLHFESTSTGMAVRYRYNGDIFLVHEVDSGTARDIENKVRVKAKLPLMDRQQPFDGKIRFESIVTGRLVDARISILPTIYGVSIVCRFLDPKKNLIKLGDIDMPRGVRNVMRRIIAQPQGMFLICGPTGSGKTTTLYGILQEFDAHQHKIITVEDPVEYRINGFVQCETNIKLGFAGALKSILRQDPDIILVGEIRDSDTSRIATQAALTGHLVLSTIHSNSALLAVPRLFDLGVDPHALSAALTAISAQRLLPTLCPECKVPRATDVYEQEELTKHGYNDVELVFDANPEGCSHCVKGYKGRTPIFEVLTIGPEERLALEHADVNALTALVKKQPSYSTLSKSAYRKVAEGVSSMHSALSTIGSAITAEIEDSTV